MSLNQSKADFKGVRTYVFEENHPADAACAHTPSTKGPPTAMINGRTRRGGDQTVVVQSEQQVTIIQLRLRHEPSRRAARLPHSA